MRPQPPMTMNKTRQFRERMGWTQILHGFFCLWNEPWGDVKRCHLWSWKRTSRRYALNKRNNNKKICLRRSMTMNMVQRNSTQLGGQHTSLSSHGTFQELLRGPRSHLRGTDLKNIAKFMQWSWLAALTFNSVNLSTDFCSNSALYWKTIFPALFK